MAPERRPIKVRLLEKRVITDSGCWEWTGAFTGDGYGVIGVGRQKQRRVHRLAYQVFKGETPDGMFVCHSCDNPKCFNPDHLFLGTPKDNTADMIAKGRAVRLRGNNHPQSKVTEAGVREMRDRRAKGETLISLSVRFGITFQHVSNICRRKTWKQV